MSDKPQHQFKERDTKQVAAWVAVVVAVIVFVLTAALFSRPAPEPQQTTEAAPATQEEPAPKPKPPKPINLSGTGNLATDKFQLSSGLATFKFSYKGSSNFVVYLLDDEGNEVDTVANEIDSTTGSYATRIDAPGTYLLNVEADGPWTVDITQ